MGFKLSSLKTDQKKEDEGVWVSDTFQVVPEEEHDAYLKENPDDILLLITSISGRKYEFAAQKKLFKDKKARRRARSGRFDAEENEAETIRDFSRNVLHGWKNLVADDGSPIVWTREAALEAMLGNRGFYKLVRNLAANDEFFLVDDGAESEGNSSNASSGTQSGGDESPTSQT